MCGMSFSSSVEALRDIDASGSRAHVNETPSSDPFLDAETAKSAEKDKKEHVMRALLQAQQTSLRAASSREDFRHFAFCRGR